ncbi:hypothetical protein VSU19_07660 [Verrucomicrobiales bacterium BCK34]|nr:hypothetical protein [Verrucomicrobiales bacterium BCK34]
MKFLPLLLTLLSSSTALFAQVSAPAPPANPGAVAEESDYIRFVEEPGTPDRLQTAVASFHKGGTTVDLVSVVHLGDKAYFENLNAFLKDYDLVLYEMVGGKYSPPPANAVATPPGIEEMVSVRGIQQMASQFLGLEFQLDGIEYESPNFVHADVDAGEYQSLMEARNQNFGTLFTRAMSIADTADLGGIPTDDAAMSAMLGRIMSAVTTGNSAELKRTIAPLMAEAESFITQLEGDDGTVLVTERNKLVMKKLDEELKIRPLKRVAIFYGGGHMPDLEKRLLAQGHEKGSVAWVDAWTIEDPVPGAAAAAPQGFSAADMLIKLIGDNSELMSSIQQIGEVLQEIAKEAGTQ